MEFYAKKDPTGRKGTRVGIKIDKASAATIGSVAGLVYHNFKKDQELKDAASGYILKSVDFNRKAEETDDPEKKKEYEAKSKEYENKAREISTLINKRKEALKSRDFKESIDELNTKINDAFNKGIITESQKDMLTEYTNENNYFLKEEVDYEL